MEIAVIIQSRLDSFRLPFKALEIIENNHLLWHIIHRIKKMGLPIIIATTNRPIDDSIVKIAENSDVIAFRGNTDDVLDRYYQCTKKFSLKKIIRITGDCPLIDPNESIKVVNKLNLDYDYVGLDEITYPDGLDTEGFTFNILEKAWKNAKLKSEREHVTPYMKNPKNLFSIFSIVLEKNFGNFRWTVDYPDDLEFIRKIYKSFSPRTIFYLKLWLYWSKN